MRIRRATIAVLIVATVAFFAIQFSKGLASLDSNALPGLGRTGAVVLLLVLGQLFIGEALVAISPTPTTPRQARIAFHITQPAKYVPVGIAQAAGLTVVLSRFGARRGHAAASWVFHTGFVVLAGVGVGISFGVAGGWPLWILPLAVGIPLATWHPALDAVLRRLADRVPMTAKLGGPPSQGALLRSLGANSIGLALHGAAFALLVAPLDPGVATAIAAYALAQGLATATPLPGGLGVREALLLGLLNAGDSSVLTSVVLIRVLLMSVEFVLWLAATTGSRVLLKNSTAGIPAARQPSTPE